MTKNELLYEGKAKKVWTTDDPTQVVVEFKDDATAFDGKKKGVIEQKGVLNNKISSRIFEWLAEKGIKTHYISMPSEREMLVKKVEIIPVEVVIRNIAAGSLSKRMGVPEGSPLKETIVELYYKSDPLGDPMINGYHIRAFGLATDSEIKEMETSALKINEILRKFFDERGIMLVDFKLEFGRYKGEILLADEITPDGCRLWDKATKDKLDKDRFRRDLGGVTEAYEKVMRMVER